MIGKPKSTLAPNPRDGAGFLSKMTFWWLMPLFQTAQTRPLEKEDLYNVQRCDVSADLGERMAECWELEKEAAKTAAREPYYARAILRMFGFSYFRIGILTCIEECVIRVGQPIFLGLIIRSLVSEGTPGIDWFNTWLYTGMLVFFSVVYIIVHHPAFYGTTWTGMRLRVSTCALLYRKALRLSSKTLGEAATGQMVNLLSNDVNRFDHCVIFLHYLWVGPLQTVIVTSILWYELGPSCLAGLLLLFLCIPLQSWMGRVFSNLRLATALKTDKRICIMNEIVKAITVIKMYAWQEPFEELLRKTRKKEVDVIMKTNYLRSIIQGLFQVSSKLFIFLSLLTFILTGNALTAEKVFVTISLLNGLKLSMTLFFPFAISLGSEALISCTRIQNFLEKDEREESSGILSIDQKSPLDSGIVVKNISASWTEGEPTLSNISFTAKVGELITVIGKVGSGKSSLLQTLLKELPINDGTIALKGCLSYAAQEPWIFAGSVRDNIVFGQEYNAKKYGEVLRVCALEKDLIDLPYGDRTIVGERGSTLSGGQKARISLARAVYFDADVYLLDDPLSAVDSNVGEHLYEHCFRGFLKKKVRILVTHQLQHLKTASNIIILNEGRILAKGRYKDLLKKGFNFESFLTTNKEEDGIQLHLNGTPRSSFSSPTKPKIHSRSPSIQHILRGSPQEIRRASLAPENIESELVLFNKLRMIRRSSETWSAIYGSTGALEQCDIDDLSVGKGSIDDEASIYDREDDHPHGDTGAESKATGSISIKVYIHYILAGGGLLNLILFITLALVTQVIICASDYWLAYWTNQEGSLPVLDVGDLKETLNDTLNSGIDQTFDRNMYVYIYAGITAALFAVCIIRTVHFFKTCMTASKTLHKKMFYAVVRTPVQFFNTHPVGQILNRFTKDIGQVDDLLPTTLFDFISLFLQIVGIILLISYINVWILIPTFLLFFIFIYMRRYYLRAARDLKRLEAITRSPVFSHLSTSLHGLSTIRTLGVEDYFTREFDRHQDLHSSAWYLFLSTTRLFGIWLDVISVIYIAIVTFSFLGMQDVLGGDVGLSISSAISLSGMFQWCVRQSAEVESQMTSVERLREYSKLEPEESPEKIKESPPKDWPNKGKIKFDDVSLFYDESNQPVLKNLKFTIQPTEKIGIVGRTGAGKSSLLNCLLRLFEPTGYIYIDDVVTNRLPLNYLRKAISIIPQAPTLFSGTLRYNLDPFNQHTDDQLWSALEQVQLLSAVNDTGEGLNTLLHEGGSNLSVGQRQLLCLARAILRSNKILVLDEATANVDPHTDHLIQETIRKKFVDCTVLTIAHRLHTIMDSNKVMVLDQGKLKEFDVPHILLQKEDSTFTHLVEKTGKTIANDLKKLAKKAYEKRKQISMANTSLIEKLQDQSQMTKENNLTCMENISNNNYNRLETSVNIMPSDSPCIAVTVPCIETYVEGQTLKDLNSVEDTAECTKL